MRRYPLLCISAAAAALGACSTQELTAEPLTIAGAMPDADRGALLIVFASSAETFEQDQARATANQYGSPYHLFMDGRQLAYYSNVDSSGNGVAPQPFTITEGSEAGIGFLPAGRHEFRIARAGGGPTIVSVSDVIQAGSTTRLYIYGPLHDLQARVVSYPSEPPAGKIHVNLTNLVRTGQRIEVVACAEDRTCAALSTPLALGESFDADFPGGPVPEGQRLMYGLSTGERIGLRQVPDARLPAPPVQLMYPGIDLYPSPDASGPPANLIGAPSYMSPEGQVQAYYL